MPLENGLVIVRLYHSIFHYGLIRMDTDVLISTSHGKLTDQSLYNIFHRKSFRFYDNKNRFIMNVFCQYCYYANYMNKYT